MPVDGDVLAEAISDAGLLRQDGAEKTERLEDWETEGRRPTPVSISAERPQQDRKGAEAVRRDRPPAIEPLGLHRGSYHVPVLADDVESDVEQSEKEDGGERLITVPEVYSSRLHLSGDSFGSSAAQPEVDQGEASKDRKDAPSAVEDTRPSKRMKRQRATTPPSDSSADSRELLPLRSETEDDGEQSRIGGKAPKTTAVEVVRPTIDPEEYDFFPAKILDGRSGPSLDRTRDENAPPSKIPGKRARRSVAAGEDDESLCELPSEENLDGANLAAEDGFPDLRSLAPDVTYEVPEVADETSGPAEDAVVDGDAPRYWLIKTQPHCRIVRGLDVSANIDQIRTSRYPQRWDGVRGFEARNNVLQMREGDLAFFYHCKCDVPAIVGTVEIVTDPCVDNTAFLADHAYYDAKSDPENPRWYAVKFRFRSQFREPLPLRSLRRLKTFRGRDGPLRHMETLNHGQLSVSHVTKPEWDFILGCVEEEMDPQRCEPLG